MFKIKGNKFTRFVGKTGLAFKKNSPAVLTGVGVVGTVVTAVLAYKTAPKVELIVEEMEQARALEERYIALKSTSLNDLNDNEVEELYDITNRFGGQTIFDRNAYVVRLVKTTVLPITTGVLTITAFLYSYKILSGRVASLASVVASMAADKIEHEAHLRDVLNEEDYAKVMSPVKETKLEIEQEDGSTKVIDGNVKRVESNLCGGWFSDSSEFVSDDHQYNLQWIDRSEAHLESLLALRGYILLNEVFDELGFQRTPEGAIMGWSFGDSFAIGKDVCDTYSAAGDFITEIYVKWPEPRMIYNDVEFKGRYSI